jgi:hypothetical protein
MCHLCHWIRGGWTLVLCWAASAPLACGGSTISPTQDASSTAAGGAGPTSSSSSGTTTGSATGAGGDYCQGGDYHRGDCCSNGAVVHDCCLMGGPDPGVFCGCPASGSCGGSSGMGGMGGAPISDAASCSNSCSADPGTPVCLCPPGSTPSSGTTWCNADGPGTSFFGGQCQLDATTMCGCRVCYGQSGLGCWSCWPKGQPSPRGSGGAFGDTFCCGDCGDAGPDSPMGSGSGGGAGGMSGTGPEAGIDAAASE